MLRRRFGLAAAVLAAIAASISGVAAPAGAKAATEIGPRVPTGYAMTVSSSLNPSTFGESVTFTATVTRNGSPVTEGVVYFHEYLLFLSAVDDVDANGQASWTTSELPVGRADVLVFYHPVGSDAVAGAQIGQMVNDIPTTTSTTTTSVPTSTTTSTTTTSVPASTSTTTTTSTPGLTTSTIVTGPAETMTELSSSANPSQVGQPVTFTATVAPVAGFGSAPVGFRSATRPQQIDGGTFTIRDSDTVLATLAADGGRASFTTSSLRAGVRTITATFSGTATAGPSSATITQQVNQAAATLPATR